MRAFLYVILFVALSPSMFFHIAAPKSKSIQLKSVIIHAFLFGIAAYALNVLVKAYPILDGFADNSPSIKDSIMDFINTTIINVKETIGVRTKTDARIPSHGGSLPLPMKPEQAMQHSIQYTASYGKVGSHPGV